MFEKFRSSNAIIEFHSIENYIDKLNKKQYKDKNIQDFISNIKIEEGKVESLKNGTEIIFDIYTLVLDNITYEHRLCRNGNIFNTTKIKVDDILIYWYSEIYFDGSWVHKTPKEMLKQMIKHSKIFKEYNKQLKDYFKHNNDYAIEQRKLNSIFSK